MMLYPSLETTQQNTIAEENIYLIRAFVSHFFAGEDILYYHLIATRMSHIFVRYKHILQT